MEIQSLETFVTVVQQGNFSKAAEKQGYTQAAITIQIKKLEKELGVCLFDRLGRKISLTSSGKIFYQNAIEILNSITRAKEAVNSTEELHGDLYIGTIDSICSYVMHHIIEDFYQRHPHIRMRIVTDTIVELMEKLNNNDLDLLYIADARKEVSGWIKVKEKEEKCHFVVSAYHPLVKKTEEKGKLSFTDLLEYPFFLTEKDASYRQILDHIMEKRKQEIVPYMESTNPSLILNMLTRNKVKNGIALLPAYVVEDDVKEGKLVSLKLEDVEITIWHQFFYHKDKWISKEMDAFLEYLQDEL